MVTNIVTKLNSLEENKNVNGTAINVKFSKSTGYVLKEDIKMQQKQAVQILEVNPKPQVSGLYTLADLDYLNEIEDLIKATDNKPVRGNIYRLYPRILKVFRLSATILLKVLSWLSKLGSSEIDVEAIETSHNYHHGSRIQGLGH